MTRELVLIVCYGLAAGVALAFRIRERIGGNSAMKETWEDVWKDPRPDHDALLRDIDRECAFTPARVARRWRILFFFALAGNIAQFFLQSSGPETTIAWPPGVALYASVAALPATCAAGELAFVSEAAVGEQIYFCTTQHVRWQRVAAK